MHRRETSISLHLHSLGCCFRRCRQTLLPLCACAVSFHFLPSPCMFQWKVRKQGHPVTQSTVSLFTGYVIKWFRLHASRSIQKKKKKCKREEKETSTDTIQKILFHPCPIICNYFLDYKLIYSFCPCFQNLKWIIHLHACFRHCCFYSWGCQLGQ